VVDAVAEVVIAIGVRAVAEAIEIEVVAVESVVIAVDVEDVTRMISRVKTDSHLSEARERVAEMSVVAVVVIVVTEESAVSVDNTRAVMVDVVNVSQESRW
jgi:hypothetical protein